jgi:uncharacterized membrane protein (UPF0127 family)
VSGPTTLVVAETGEVLAERVTWARRPLERVRGLLGRPPLALGEALVIEPAAQVHSLGLRYAIDVVFCDASGAVLHNVCPLRPWRITRWVRGARYAVELPAGAVGPHVRPGMRLGRCRERDTDKT